jgi:hypothetical protein
MSAGVLEPRGEGLSLSPAAKVLSVKVNTGAISSAVEQLSYTQHVAGSNPASRIHALAKRVEL